MFTFTFPRELGVTFKVHQFLEKEISWDEIREVMGNMALLLGSPLHEESKVFTMQSSDLERLYGFARGMVALYDAFYDFVGEPEKTQTIPAPIIPRTQLALVVQMHSNALQSRNIFIHFLNQVICTLGFHIFFEIIDEGAIIFVQDRKSFSFIAQGINPSFIDAILDSEQSLRGPNPRPLAIELLRRLGISLQFSTKSS